MPNVMQVYSDRFETVLPKTARFFTQPKPQPAKEKPWALIASACLITVLTVALIVPRQPATSSRDVQAPSVAPLPPPIPDVAPPVPRAMPVPTTGSAPRAKLVHIRALGSVENDRMPDGRILTTRYMGELSGAGSLPTRGAQLGDMWYTQNDGHCWVLAPLSPNSASIGWIDP